MNILDNIRSVDGCGKNAYHVKALHNAGDCDTCLVLLSRHYMRIFLIDNHVDFGSVTNTPEHTTVEMSVINA